MQFFLHREQFLTVRFKKENAQAVHDHLISEQKACRERISEEEQRFTTLVAMRQKTLKDIKVSIISLTILEGKKCSDSQNSS